MKKILILIFITNIKMFVCAIQITSSNCSFDGSNNNFTVTGTSSAQYVNTYVFSVVSGQLCTPTINKITKLSGFPAIVNNGNWSISGAVNLPQVSNQPYMFLIALDNEGNLFTVNSSNPDVTSTDGSPVQTLPLPSCPSNQVSTTSQSSTESLSSPLTQTSKTSSLTSLAEFSTLTPLNITAQQSNTDTSALLTLPNNKIFNSQKIYLNGQADANALVQISIDDNNVGQTKATNQGIWNFKVHPTLSQGIHRVKITSSLKNKPAQTQNTFHVVVPVSVKITSPKDNSTAQGQIRVKGIMSNAENIEIFLDNNKVGNANIRGKYWAFTIPSIEKGTHSITVQATDKEGITFAKESIKVNIM